MPRTLEERKVAEIRRFSTNFQTMIEHLVNSSKTSREHVKNVNELDVILHDISIKVRLFLGECPKGFIKCADGGCVPNGGTCPAPPKAPKTI